MYVDRDQDGKITGGYAMPQRYGHEWVDDDKEEIKDLLGTSAAKIGAKQHADLKAQARAGLAFEIGDWGDNIADALRCMVLGRAIVDGTVTDEVIIKRYDDYCALLLAGYGGAEAVMHVLEADAISFKKWIIDYYYAEKAKKA